MYNHPPYEVNKLLYFTTLLRRHKRKDGGEYGDVKWVPIKRQYINISLSLGKEKAKP